MTQKHFFISISIALLALLASVTFWTHRSVQQQINKEAEADAKTVQHMLQGELSKDAALMHALMDVIQQDTRLRRAWIARDKEKLHTYSSRIFQAIRKDHKVTHFYFHTPDRINFLRVHEPSRFGDFINRHTMKAAAEKGELSYGIELGVYGTFTLRVVLPWVINEELVGYIELGKELDQITPSLQEILSVELFFLIDKEFVDRLKWEQGLKIFGNTGDWDQLNQFVIIDQTLPSFPHDLHENFISRARLKDPIVEVSAGSLRYSVKILPLEDVSGAELGKIIVLFNISAKKALIKKLLLFQFMGFLIVGSGLLFYYHVVFWRRES